MIERQQTLRDTLLEMEDDLDIYDYFIEKALSCPDYKIREKEYQIEGCVSGLWVKAELSEGKIHAYADSDSLLIKGIALAICEIFDGLLPNEAEPVEITFLEGFDLAGELDTTRRNGLDQMIQRIKNV